LVDFINNDPSLESQWRSLILFGKNVATYKFAFARSLLDLVDDEKTIITLEELSNPFSKHIISHLKNHDKQGSSPSSSFLDACRKNIRGEISEQELLKITTEKGFVNVIDAFQNLAGGQIERPFYVKDYSRGSKKIIVTDELLSLKGATQFSNFDLEVDARWSLVETAWSIGISPNLLEVHHNENDDTLFIETDLLKRIDITSSRDALNGYQKGRCFYCSNDISIVSGTDDICHIDHFLPHLHKQLHLPSNINGVWNLVLSCSTCNGAGEKGAKTPHIRFLSRLNKRNEYYISSKHPLSETIKNQTGYATEDRIKFLNKHYQITKDNNGGSPWQPKDNPPSQL
jgi:5-methylcytosine-specific restriction endonuclease McrA